MWRNYRFKSRKHRVPDKLDPKRNTPRRIIIKMPKVKDKERIFLLLLIFREREREGEREGEKHQCVVASRAPPTGGPGPHPRHVPWLGIEPATLWFAGRHSIHWATPARDNERILKAARKEQKVTYKGVPIRLSVDFSKGTVSKKGLVRRFQSDEKQEPAT